MRNDSGWVTTINVHNHDLRAADVDKATRRARELLTAAKASPLLCHLWALGDFNGPAGPGIEFLTRLTLLREVNFDSKTNDLVSNPVPAQNNQLQGTRPGLSPGSRGAPGGLPGAGKGF